MPAIAMPRWIKKGYDGMTFFGYIITHTEQDAEAFNQRFGIMKNHEMIHLYQARSCHDSWLCFYWRYFVFWLKGCRLRKKLKNTGYWLNPFELEAYRNMHNLDYLKDRSEATQWREYASMTTDELLALYSETYGWSNLSLIHKKDSTTE